MKLPIMQFSPTSRQFASLRFKYSPQHRVLRHSPWMSEAKFHTHTEPKISKDYSKLLFFLNIILLYIGGF
jgi:hypothetical protein